MASFARTGWLVRLACCLIPCCFGLAGCVPANQGEKKITADGDHGHEHGHHHHDGPHKGTMVVFGDEVAHLELVLDGESGKMTGYTYDAHVEKAVPVKHPALELAISLETKNEKGETEDELVELKLEAVSPSEGGEATEFAGQSDKLKGAKKFNAVLKGITILGKDFKDTQFKFPEGNHHH